MIPRPSGRGNFISSDLALEGQKQQYTGDQQHRSQQHGAGPGIAGGLLPALDHAGFAQRGDQGLVQEQHEGGVQAGLQQVKGQEHGNQHTGHHFPFVAQVQRRDQPVPQQHGGDHHHAAHDQRHDGAGHGPVLLINKGSGAGKAAGGQQVHQRADGAGIADGDHFHQRNDEGDDKGRQGAEEEAADGDDDVLGFVLQEQDHRDPDQAHHDVGDGSQHGQKDHFLNGIGITGVHRFTSTIKIRPENPLRA